MKSARLALLPLALALLPTPVLAKDKEPVPMPELYSKLSACRAIQDAAARLACFDETAGKLDAAIATKEVVVVDKAQVEKTKRGLFGLRLPSFGVFGGGDDENGANQLDQIEAKVASAKSGLNGWLIKLDDGTSWQQTDTNELALSPKPGDAVLVKRAALSSYRMTVGKQQPIKVRRVL